MLEYTRQTTLNAVEQLTIEQLDFRHEPDGNSIGTLLSHIAAVEWAYSLPTFESRKPTSAEKERWGPALYLISVPQELGELLFWRVRRQNPVLVKRVFFISLKT